jgi:hypothetical protein
MSINTEFGVGYIDDGYIRICSQTEGNKGKYLHRLVYEKHYGKVEKGMVIHHKNGNKLDNSIENLIAMPRNEHVKHHVRGENNPLYGRDFSKEHRRKMSEAKKGIAIGSNANNAKYTLWNSEHAILDKRATNPIRPRRCFKFNYKGLKIPLGMFNEWISCEIINELIEEAIA